MAGDMKVKEKKKEDIKVSQDLLENLDLLLNYEALESEDSWDTLSGVDDLEQEEKGDDHDDET